MHDLPLFCVCKSPDQTDIRPQVKWAVVLVICRCFTLADMSCNTVLTIGGRMTHSVYIEFREEPYTMCYTQKYVSTSWVTRVARESISTQPRYSICESPPAHCPLLPVHLLRLLCHPPSKLDGQMDRHFCFMVLEKLCRGYCA